MFDRGVAEALGVRIGRTGADVARIKMLGSEWPVQFEIVDLSLGDAFAWTTRVALVTDPGLAMPFQGVLGSEGFFRRFAVTFNEYYGFFAVESADDVEPARPTSRQDEPYEPYDPQWNRPEVF